MTIDISYFQFTMNDHSRMIVLNSIKKSNSKVRLKGASNFMVQTCTEKLENYSMENSNIWQTKKAWLTQWR